MLSTNLHKQVFPDCYPESRIKKVSEGVLLLALEHLNQHKIPVEERRPNKPEINLNLPALLDRNIQRHFWKLGDLMGWPYFQMAEEFSRLPGPPFAMDMSFMEGKWSNAPGWTQYAFDGTLVGAAPFPQEEVIVFDVETCPDFGPWPLLAVAMSSRAIYGWVSPIIFGQRQEAGPPPLIPLQDAQASLCIGHNVSYDRARILQEYKLDRSPRRFFDTLSMHCAVAGLSSQQRCKWTSFKKKNFSEPPAHGAEEQTAMTEQEQVFDKQDSKWMAMSSMNNLADVVRLHCSGYELDKSTRDILVHGTIENIRTDFQKVMTYCGNDVAATAGLYRELWPKFLEKCPHPTTFAALLEMGTCFLPVNEKWSIYVGRVERMYQDALEKIEALLRDLVEVAALEGGKDDKWREDPWLNKMDWTPVPEKYTKAKLKADGSYSKNGEPRPIGNTFLFGKPAWYKKIYNAAKGRPEVTPKIRILPYLLKMKWSGHPVHFIEGKGWCYGVEIRQKAPLKGTALTDEAFPGWHYYKIPHHEHEGANVGSLMTKHHLSFYEQGILTTPSPIVKEVMEVNSRFSFWISYRERIKEQFVIWQDHPKVSLGFKSGERAGMILPGMIAMGTVTRRAVEPLWMTATNSKKSLAGSELKSNIVAPEGFVFVGADVDSQELWISSLLGDAQFGFAGATAMGWMTLQGSKSNHSDLHSRTAQILGMNRDDAKIFTYGRIYGAGVKYAAQLLQKFNPSLARETAEKRAEELYNATKGRRQYEKGSKRRYYVAGTETFMFNVLERIARSDVSKTPALSCAISDALISDNVKEEFLTSRVNWAVQSSGVDYLHMVVNSMAYLLRTYGIQGRLVLTIHDEVRYLVKEEDQFRAALALQVANIWTRAMFAHRVGMNDLPLVISMPGHLNRLVCGLFLRSRL